uniref:Uncharacterized protein n=1 Tax=Eutreptiella gymnastica TaxID=73025 RepID=A0A7S1IYL2_9EUGL
MGGMEPPDRLMGRVRRPPGLSQPTGCHGFWGKRKTTAGDIQTWSRISVARRGTMRGTLHCARTACTFLVMHATQTLECHTTSTCTVWCVLVTLVPDQLSNWTPSSQHNTSHVPSPTGTPSLFPLKGLYHLF